MLAALGPHCRQKHFRRIKPLLPWPSIFGYLNAKDTSEAEKIGSGLPWAKRVLRPDTDVLNVPGKEFGAILSDVFYLFINIISLVFSCVRKHPPR